MTTTNTAVASASIARTGQPVALNTTPRQSLLADAMELRMQELLAELAAVKVGR